ncbi:HDOD domain-containing protein [Desulfovibrio ferrophilus]|uniref:Metal dependent phosphohydrolase n=1 Tax=Desulfovibrio ferrophilus TaxID=241368 RepID=A0A2Z6B3Q9_9BACT|nr:HDOD domain-containing protein [Desulfovibrio ferrophilus]BBD10066.1 metal dependent phosphohydrolase [Desulfovibrio ferrophilus]
MYTDSTPTPEQFDLGRSFAARRFAFCDTNHAAVKTLFNICATYAAHGLAQGKHIPDLPAPDEQPGPSQYPKAAADPFDLLRSEAGLPSLPTIYAELQDVIVKPAASTNDVAHVISRDTSLAAFLLRLVNSAFYSFPSQIETISRAVTLVGTSQLTTLAMGTTVMKLFSDIPDELVSMESSWRHSIATGILASNLARRIGETDPERLFVAGLLHDVGLLTMYQTIPDKSRLVHSFIREHGAILHTAEMNILGFDHAMLGGMMLRKWNLPFPLINAVLRHHTPDKSEKHIEPALIHIANTLAGAMDCSATGEPFIQPLNLIAWNATGLTPEDLKETARESETQIAEACQALLCI